MLKRSREELALVETARRVLPAGGFGNVNSDLIIRTGRAGRVWDESGNEYIDYLLGAGPMLIGHARPEVNEAVREQIDNGTGFFMNNRHGIALAAAIVEAVPCAEQVRFVSTGSEADAYAIRLVRAYRKRDKILKFEGGFHGTSDATLMSFAPKKLSNFPQPVPDSAGIPQGVRDDILVAPYNDIDTFAGILREYGDVLAGVLMEPVQRIIPPKPGFLEGVRELTARHDVPLVFDEIVTGFRLAYGGAQAYYGVVPDVCTLGKALGGGYPLAAIAGREDIMAHFDAARVGPHEHLLQLGTLSGNPIAARGSRHPRGVAPTRHLRGALRDRRAAHAGPCRAPRRAAYRGDRGRSPTVVRRGLRARADRELSRRATRRCQDAAIQRFAARARRVERKKPLRGLHRAYRAGCR